MNHQLSISISTILLHELKQRQEKNSKYSLRAFARDLATSHSSLSLILANKKGLSPTMADKISQKLNFNLEEKNYFKDLSTYLYSRKKSIKQNAYDRLFTYDTRFNTLNIDYFHFISDWYSIPVMELIRIYEKKATTIFLSQRLKISKQDVERTLHSFIRLGIFKSGKITEDFLVLSDGPADKCIQQFHHNILTKAQNAILTQNVDERFLGCAVVRVRGEDIEWINDEIKKFRRKIAKKIEEGKDHDRVYALSTQFFRLDC